MEYSTTVFIDNNGNLRFHAFIIIGLVMPSDSIYFIYS